MEPNVTGGLLEKRRWALLEYCIGHVSQKDYPFVQTPEDLFELLRMDPLDSSAVRSSRVAEAISCAQHYIHAVYRKLEPGFEKHQFHVDDLQTWELYSNYSDWAALQKLALYPENFMNAAVRLRKTSLFKTLENELNSAQLSVDSAQMAVRNYLQTFEQTCDLEVISCYMNGTTPARAVYYFVGRQRVQPFQYFWRKADVNLTPTSKAVNPAAWSEWQAIEMQPDAEVLEIRPVFWNGRLCLCWAEWRDKVQGKTQGEFIPAQLSIKLAFMTQSGQWSAPLRMCCSEPAKRPTKPMMVASVRSDYLHPKGNLGILFTDIDDVTQRVHAVHDVLMRPLEHDDGLWLDAALTHRFKTPETVQHPLPSQVAVCSKVVAEGDLTPYLELLVNAYRGVNGEGKEKDVLTVLGFCKPRVPAKEATPQIKLALTNRNSGDPADVTKNQSEAGDWKMAFSTSFERDPGGWSTPPKFSFGDTAPNPTTSFGIKEFTLTIRNLMDFIPPTLVKNTTDAAQFLQFNQVELTLKYTRLNSLFGAELVARANHSVDAILDWESQFMAEPVPTGLTFEEPNGAFDGANGLFFWELFFHLPHLMATRLRDEGRFPEAQRWLHYLFDPQAIADVIADPAKPPPDAKVLYWRCRPLATGKGNPGNEALAPTDPDAIGYSTPEHFKILVFCDYVKNLMAWGDWYYRQLTSDSLVAAKLCYVQAKFLMGKTPIARALTQWETDTVKNLLNHCSRRTALEAFERTLPYSLADIAAGSDSAPPLGLIGCEPFRPEINQPLLDLFAAPQMRLDNLRQNLTIDGQPRNMPLFSPPTDPDQLLRDQVAGGSGGPRPMGGRLMVNAFRWRVTFEVALRAVQALQDIGSQVLSLLERRDRAEQEEIQQNHLVELGSYAQTVQEQSIAQLEANVAALGQSRLMAQERADAYERRYVENISTVEYQVMDSLEQSKVFALTAKVLKPVGAALAAIPNIYGLANGGHRIDKVTDAVCFGLEIAASLLQIDADKQATTEGYRRRRNEWALSRDQARAEMRAIDAQIVALSHAVAAARASLAQTLRANEQALTLYNFLKKRATNAELFGWMLAQLKALHSQAYDAVISLCLNAQASLSAETGDYDAQIPLPQVWQDNRHGLTAGEHLRGHLLRMEREYLQRYERRLELVKTISLRKLFDDPVERQTGSDNWTHALDQLRKTGSLEFRLSQLLFDRDHPGHYCRQISAVEVDLPALVGPYQDVRSILRQISSMTATKATAQSVQYMQDQTLVAPADVVINLRSGQQIALSVGIADNGLTGSKPDEGLLNPFESSGAVSTFQLNFPWPAKQPQAAMLSALTDIIVRIRYTAKAGEPTFTRQVQDMVTEAENATRLQQSHRSGQS
ncbi:Tc toxin subunit A-related protein [Pseudomonas baetica]|uniref:Tc toxin subunit A-related protein n=1 Tax=Pseudomonas baetica TaxID=674054 RepID=UPI002871775F|nr:neuraminidase-like domain-containing protein [Pseudomonas baetica]MDR9862512.1 neuraminidase-like domain-containing protein [Pseudomonas baetica]